MPRIAPRDVLLISADIAGERNADRLYQQVGGSSVQLWEIPEAQHTGAFDLQPDEYEQRVVGFFDAALAPH